jgi:EmrB/QacA subfamily drug resistance transporter
MTTPDTPIDHASGEVIVDDARQRRRILIAMCTALVAVIASVSGLNVAQQELAADLGASQSDLLWVINGYTVALAALLLPIGAVGDRYGRKHVLVSGLGLFIVANFVSAFAAGPEMLIVTRVVAGIAAAAIMPVTLSVITSSFPADERARAVGIWAGFAGAGGILGLFVSSFLIDYMTWQWLFAMPIGFGGAALAMTLSSVVNSRENQEGRFDTVGSVFSVLAIGGLVLGIHEGPVKGWDSGLTLFGLILGVVALAAFIVWELRNTAPLLDVRLFANRGLATGSVTLLVLFAVMFGLFLVLIQFFQAVLGYSALKAATGLLPMMAIMMPLSAVAPIIAQKVGTRRTLFSGLVAFIAGLVMMASMTSVSGGYWSIMPGLLVMAAGMGLSMTPATIAITESLPIEQQGVASALNDTVREVGGAIGIALLGSVLNAGYHDRVAPATKGLSPDLANRVEEGIGTAFAAAPDLGSRADAVLDAAREAFVGGWRVSMWFGVALASVALVHAVFRAPRSQPAVLEESVEELVG